MNQSNFFCGELNSWEICNYCLKLKYNLNWRIWNICIKEEDFQKLLIYKTLNDYLKLLSVDCFQLSFYLA